jgi:hypothetical protein
MPSKDDPWSLLDAEMGDPSWPELGLQQTIGLLQSDDLLQQKMALVALLVSDPSPDWATAMQLAGRPNGDPAIAQWCADLLRFVHSLVSGEDAQSERFVIGADAALRWAWIKDRRGRPWRLLVVESADVWPKLLLKCKTLLDIVGYHNVRKCSADDCPRYYLKVRRRRFCSVKCQKRMLARQSRATQREQRLRDAARRRRQKRQGV